MSSKVLNINEETIKKYIESKRPSDLEIRKQLDFGYNFDGKKAILFTIRPDWRDETKTMTSEFAKITFTKSQEIWKLYWLRASGEWKLYEPFPQSNHLSELIAVIEEDQLGCFYG